MKIVSLQAENFKRLKAVEIKPDGSTVVITGKNAQGKSSILDSIFAAVGGADALPGKPIRKGEQTARIKLDLGEVIVTRKFTAAGSTVTVEQANGARFSKPQQMLDQLIGKIAFDPLEFTRMKPADQFETIRKLVPLEVDIDALDGQNQSDYEARTVVNRDAKNLRAQAAGILVAADLPAEPIDTAALLTQMQEAGETNAEIERRKGARERAAQQIEQLTANAALRRAEAEELRARAASVDNLAQTEETSAAELQAKLDAAPALPDPIDVTAIRAQVEQADRTNSKIADRVRRQQIEAQATEKEAESQRLTDAMEARKTAKAQAIAAAKMPIAGLSFGEGEVLYNELPLSQASQAECIRVSMAVAMALNPKLRVLTIKDGSLIDEDGMAIIRDMVKDGDYQAWIEVVGSDGKIGILIEDGAVVQPADEQGSMPLDAA
jgi:DNA repair exonuclease SbcCD ATPase subunit